MVRENHATEQSEQPLLDGSADLGSGMNIPAGLRIRIHFIRIQHFRMNTDPDPIRVQGFMTKNWKKITSEKKLNFFFIKNCNLPIPRPP
jgi:hypothetical protein